MIEIILDVSANTFKNDVSYFKKMVEEISKIDSHKYKIIFKTQLFSYKSEAAKNNIVLDHTVFDRMNAFCAYYGYQLTSSVFDLESLKFLLTYKVPFVKIACRPDLYWLAGEVPRLIPVYVSMTKEYYNNIDLSSINCKDFILVNSKLLLCVPKYPASKKDYLSGEEYLFCDYISDHTKGIGLFKTFIKQYHTNGIFEMHYVLEHDTTNPDGGEFAKTIDDLKEIL